MLNIGNLHDATFCCGMQMLENKVLTNLKVTTSQVDVNSTILLQSPWQHFPRDPALSCAVDQLAIAARKALSAMLGCIGCQQLHIQSPLQKLQLFDTLVRPICLMHVKLGLLSQASGGALESNHGLCS